MEAEKAPLRKPEKKLAAAEKAAAIKRHLEIILNARQGGASSSPEFGLADFNGAAVGASDMILAMVENISNTIRDYEPRVTIESVVYKPRAEFPLELNFSISGYIKAGDYQEKHRNRHGDEWIKSALHNSSR
ncbi:type VI secretion system baseplate subunit TssE [Candidatus Vondammii sp. HM_W22]|uniref:type VI secretion system baseplate subunit TssE n=1 Tax=Candidatus Vondammii sp. HM_W22 TaxID=2687299 RepID=UPI001F140C04|nr:type VI secretion system baseplate subunit TssE [Candidatus Vondammii sp. HM_W22]